jgi:hypothetical protein
MVIRAEDIKDRESFADWLSTRPEPKRGQEAIALAHRAALRSAPFLQRIGRLEQFQHLNVIKWTFAANSISRVAAISPTYDIADAGVAAERALKTFLREFGGDLVGETNEAVYDAMSALRADIVWVYHGIHSGNDSFGHTSSAISLDASAVERGISIEKLLLTPIWQTIPDWWEAEYARSVSLLLSWQADGWDIWDQWYDDCFAGAPVFGIQTKSIRDELERNIALGSTDGKFNENFWPREPKEINADIKRWVEEAQRRDTLQLSANETPGISWRATENEFELTFYGDASDEEVAASNETAFEHERLTRVLARLLPKSSSISERQGWEDFYEAVSELSEAISCPSPQLHTRIIKIYHLGLRLTTFLDQNNILRASRGANFSQALLADESRLLLEAIQYVSPWIGRFPTAKRKDIEAGQAYRQMTHEAISTHVLLMNDAKDAGLISEKDRKLIISWIELHSKSDILRGVPAEKLQSHGVGTVKQLVLAMSILIGGEMVTDVAKETKTWKATKDFLVSHVQEVEDVILDAPAHVQTIIKSIIREYQGNPDGPDGATESRIAINEGRNSWRWKRKPRR